jgi:cation diffusion facilitator CzcD-associated flavoprotein CzcO
MPESTQALIDATTGSPVRPTPHAEVDVIIIGTGFSGIGLATMLRRSGRHSFLILERAGSIGGTWRDNAYPGAACDIQSHLYSYSFRPNPEWSHVYATQAEILAYLQQICDEEGLAPHIRFGAEVHEASWNDARRRWIVKTDSGEYVAKALVSAAGHLSDPALPDIPGLDRFSGKLFHSSRWDSSYRWEGRRVGIIGTGASAIQIVPELAKSAARVTVFQRTAPYIVPRKDYAYSEAERRMFARLPGTAQAIRDDLFWDNEARFPQRRGVPVFINQITKVALAHLEAQVADPDLRERLTPHYAIGCKRILISNDYFPALCQANVELNTDGIERITQGAVETRTGRQIDLDLLVVATGFEATDLPIAHRIIGRDDHLLSDHWSDGGRALACTSVTGFPNFFVMLGPNTGLGAGSMIYMVETQIAYICEAVHYLLERDADIEPDPEAEEQYVESIDARSVGSVWLSGGCHSWYVHPGSGRLTTLWPDFMSQFRTENGHFNPEHYLVSFANA